MAASTTIKIRASKRVRDLIDRGAAAAHKSRSAFVLDAGATAAQNVLLDQTCFALSPTQIAEFERIMNEPLSDNQGVSDLFASRAPWER